MVIDLQQVMTQAEFGELVGITQPAVSKLVSIGALPASATVGAMLLMYCQRLREMAAGRGSDGDLDLAQERAALARAQREGVEMRNALARKEYAPIMLLGEVLAAASQAVSERFDHLPAMLKRACPDLPEAARNQVMETIAAARNEWVQRTGLTITGFLTAREEQQAEDSM